MFNILTYVGKAISESVIIGMLSVHIFNGKKVSNFRVGIQTALYILVVVLQLHVAYGIAQNILTGLLMLAVCTTAYRMKWGYRILAVAISYGMAAGCEAIVWLPIRYITGLEGTEISPRLWYYPLTTLATAATGLLAIWGLCWFVKRLRRNAAALYGVVLVIVCVLCLFMVIMLVTFAQTPYLPIAIMTALLVMVLIALCAGLFRDQLRVQQERLRLEFLEKQSADQIAHYTALYQNAQDIHKIRHDMKNFVIAAQGYLQGQDYDELKAHLDGLLGEIQPPALTDTGNPLLDAVVTAKRAAAPDIDFRMSLMPLAYQHIDPMDVAQVLAAALDNAIEGCAGVPAPYIDLRIARHAQFVTVTVANPTAHRPQIRHGRLVTRKEHPEQHGYGVRGMQKIADKYQGHLKWRFDGTVFHLSDLLQDL